MILFFLFLLNIDIVEGAMATVSVLGKSMNRASTISNKMVRGIYGAIATYLYVWGMVIAVFASAGLIPSVLEPGRIELLLSKPVSRTHILMGRYLGNVLVISCNVFYLVLGVWVIFGQDAASGQADFPYLDCDDHLRVRGAAERRGADRRAV